MNNANPKYSLWLCPDEQNQHLYVDCIQKLARQLNTPVFAPHITVCSAIHTFDQSTKQQLITLAKASSPITIEALQFDYQHEFYKSLYIDVVRTPKIQTLHNQACSLLDSTQSNSIYQPHISLAYFDPNLSDQATLCESLDPSLLSKSVFNQLVLIETSGDIDQWTTQLQIPL